MPAGRPRILTDEERKTHTKASKAKFKNLTIDQDLVEVLNTYADNLEPELGFRPTISQALRAMLHAVAKKETKR
jgi:hypothetical protein